MTKFMRKKQREELNEFRSRDIEDFLYESLGYKILAEESRSFAVFDGHQSPTSVQIHATIANYNIAMANYCANLALIKQKEQLMASQEETFRYQEKIGEEIIKYLSSIKLSRLARISGYENPFDMPLDKVITQSKRVRDKLPVDVKTLGDLIQKTERQLLAVNGLGRASLSEIRRNLDKFGLELRKE